MENQDNKAQQANEKFEPGVVREGQRQLHNDESPALQDSDRWGKTDEIDATSGDNSNVKRDDQQNSLTGTDTEEEGPVKSDDQEATDFNQQQNEDDDRTGTHTTGVGE